METIKSNLNSAEHAASNIENDFKKLFLTAGEKVKTMEIM
jgi:hypothetical protein